MRKVSVTLAAAAAIIFTAVPATAASAASGPVLACRISPFPSAPSGWLLRDRQGPIVVQHPVRGAGGSGTYTYTWIYPSGYTVAGCTSASDICSVEGVHATHEVDLGVTVVIQQGSSSATLSADAAIAKVCGSSFC